MLKKTARYHETLTHRSIPFPTGYRIDLLISYTPILRSLSYNTRLYLAHPRPLPATPRHNTRPTPRRHIIPTTTPLPLLPLIWHQLQNIIRELCELETHGLEFWLGLVMQAETPGCPERSNRFANGCVFGIGIFEYKARVREFALDCGCCAVNFAVCEGFELGS